MAVRSSLLKHWKFHKKKHFAVGERAKYPATLTPTAENAVHAISGLLKNQHPSAWAMADF